MSNAQQRAKAKYNKKAYDRFLITVRKGERDEIKKYAEEKGKSLNAYIVELIEKDMKKAAD